MTMKKILLIVAILIMAVSQQYAYAQYVAEGNSGESFEHLYQQDNVRTGLGKGVHMTDAGKALFYTGASVALTGVACFLAGAAMYDPDPCCPTMPVYPLFAIAGLVGGGAIALIGLPFYAYGNKRMSRYGSSHITFGDEEQEGGTGFVEMGLGIPNALSLDAVGGYNFGKNFFLGAGLGYRTYLTAGLRNDGAADFIPIYANFRYSIGKKRVVPFVGASLGYDIANAGLYSGVEVGTRIRKVAGERGESWWFGLSTELISTDDMLISLKVGKSF